jgi:CRISPR-associated protein Cas1
MKSGKPSLVFDFVEPFRPITVDKPLIVGIGDLKLRLINGLLDYDSRRAIARLILDNLSKEYVNQRTRRRVPLVEIIKQETWYLASIIRDGSVKDYKCFTWVF